MKLDSYNPKLKPNARNLRANMTPEERHLWYDFLREYPIQFKRQRPIARYIADFYCPQAKLVIELDGSQHFTEDGKECDALRTYIIEQFGIEVIRFTNWEINRQFDSVCAAIDERVRFLCGSHDK